MFISLSLLIKNDKQENQNKKKKVFFSLTEYRVECIGCCSLKETKTQQPSREIKSIRQNALAESRVRYNV